MSQPIQLYAFQTPNGQKASIALEEMNLPYTTHCVDIRGGEQFTDEYKAINPNSKIPAIVDPESPDGKPLAVFESGAVLVYLAEKSGKFLSSEPRKRSETIQWLFFQNAGVGPMFGQFGHFFKYAKDSCDHPYPLERYTKEAKRLLGVLEARLADRDYLVGEYSIADMATFPWVNALSEFYGADDALDLANVPNVLRWRDRCAARSAVQRGMAVCAVGN